MDASTPEEQLTGIQLASKFLREELLKSHAQKIWARHLPETLEDRPADIISYRAIARAMVADQKNRYGIDESPSRYKDRVRHAVIGQRMTHETVELFAETFDFSPDVVEKINHCISAEEVEKDPADSANWNFQMTPTSSFYDMYFNEQGEVYKLDCALVVRAGAEPVSEIWGTYSEDITTFDVIEGGVSEWSEEKQAWRVTLEYPLAPNESIMVRYILEIKPNYGPDELVVLESLANRQACFYRLFFADARTAPPAVKISRKFASGSFTPFGSDIKEYFVPVYENRASFYLDNLYKETIVFSSASAESVGEAS